MSALYYEVVDYLKFIAFCLILLLTPFYIGNSSAEDYTYNIENPKKIIDLSVTGIKTGASTSDAVSFNANFEITNNKAIFYKVYVRHFAEPETVVIVNPKGKYTYAEQFTLPLNTSQTVSHAIMIDDDVLNLNTWQILWHGITGEYLSFDISDVILEAANIPDNAETYLKKLSKLKRKGFDWKNYKYEKWPDTKSPYARVAAFGTLLKIAKDLNDGKLEPQDQIDLAAVILQHILSDTKIREKVIYQLEKKLGKIVAEKITRKLLAFFAQIDWFLKVHGQAAITWDIWDPLDWSDSRHTDIVSFTINVHRQVASFETPEKHRIILSKGGIVVVEKMTYSNISPAKVIGLHLPYSKGLICGSCIGSDYLEDIKDSTELIFYATFKLIYGEEKVLSTDYSRCNIQKLGEDNWVVTFKYKEKAQAGTEVQIKVRRLNKDEENRFILMRGLRKK